MKVTQVLTNPGQFYGDSDNITLKSAIGIIAVVALFRFISTLPPIKLTYDIFALVTDGPPAAIFLVTQSLSALLIIPVTWIGAGVIVHLLASYLFGVDSEFERTLAIVGWAYVPKLFFGLVHLLVGMRLYVMKDLPLEASYATPQAGHKALEGFLQVPPHQATHMLGFLLIIWCGFIGARGMSEHYDFDLRKARISVLTPAVLYVAFRIGVAARQGALPIQ